MSGGFTGRCSTCGGWGHMAYECPNTLLFSPSNQVNRAQPQHQPQEQVVPHNAIVLGSNIGQMPGQPQDELARDIAALRASRAAVRERIMERRRARDLDIRAIPILGRPGSLGPVRPQAQAGRGALPGARNEQPSRASAGLLGNHRVERAQAAPGQQQHHRQPRVRDRPFNFTTDEEEEEDEEVVNSPRSGRVQGPENTTRGRGQGSMAQEQGEVANHVGQARLASPGEHPRAAPVNQPVLLHQLAPGQYSGYNLTPQNVQAVIAMAARGHPNRRFDITIRPMSATPTIVTGSSGHPSASRDESHEDSPDSDE